MIEQADEKAKSKLDLIRTRKELEEADILNTRIGAKEQLKVVHTLNDTDSINNLSVEPKSFTSVNCPRINLNPDSPKLYVPSDLNLIHKPQITNLDDEHVRPSTLYCIPRNLSN